MRLILLLPLVLFVGCSDSSIPTHTIREKISKTVPKESTAIPQERESQSILTKNTKSKEELQKELDEAFDRAFEDNRVTDEEQDAINKINKEFKRLYPPEPKKDSRDTVDQIVIDKEQGKSLSKQAKRRKAERALSDSFTMDQTKQVEIGRSLLISNPENLDRFVDSGTEMLKAIEEYKKRDHHSRVAEQNARKIVYALNDKIQKALFHQDRLDELFEKLDTYEATRRAPLHLPIDENYSDSLVLDIHIETSYFLDEEFVIGKLDCGKLQSYDKMCRDRLIELKILMPSK